MCQSKEAALAVLATQLRCVATRDSRAARSSVYAAFLEVAEKADKSA